MRAARATLAAGCAAMIAGTFLPWVELLDESFTLWQFEEWADVAIVALAALAIAFALAAVPLGAVPAATAAAALVVSRITDAAGDGQWLAGAGAATAIAAGFAVALLHPRRRVPLLAALAFAFGVATVAGTLIETHVEIQVIR